MGYIHIKDGIDVLLTPEQFPDHTWMNNMKRLGPGPGLTKREGIEDRIIGERVHEWVSMKVEI